MRSRAADWLTTSGGRPTVLRRVVPRRPRGTTRVGLLESDGDAAVLCTGYGAILTYFLKLLNPTSAA